MSTVRCPICLRPLQPQHSPAMPFCGERCRLVDLSRWFEQRYGLPIEPEDESPAEEGPAAAE